MVRGAIRAGIEEIVESRATHRQSGRRRELIVQSPQHLVHAAREVHVDVEGRIWTVVGVGLRLVFVFVTAEEVYPILDDRSSQGAAQLLVRVGEDALGDKIRGVERVVPEISG